jgi:hypothetical protein
LSPPLPNERQGRRPLTDRRNNQQDSARLLKPFEGEQPIHWCIGNYGHDEFSGILTDMCGVIVKTIGLIPSEHREARLLACAYVLAQINDAVERMVNGGNATEH